MTNCCTTNQYQCTECAICLEPIQNQVTLTCGHQYHNNCMKLLIASALTPSCPLCRAPIALSSRQKMDKGVEMYYELEHLVRMGIASWTDLNELEIDHMNSVIDLWMEAADDGQSAAMYNLALMYRSGRGVEQSNLRAFEWYERAASLGHAQAQNNLGYMYHHGERLGTPACQVKAARWYRAAAEQGIADAQFNVGVMHKLADDEDANDWFNMAFHNGCESAIMALVRNGKISPLQYCSLTEEEMNREETCLESAQLECA